MRKGVCLAARVRFHRPAYETLDEMQVVASVRALRVLVLLVSLLLAAVPAAVQRTGGSFGGGDRGSSPSTSSGRSSPEDA